MPGKLSDVALRTSLLYALAAAVWILVSDEVLVALVPDPQIMGKIALGKGWAFVVVTALLLFGALRGQLRRWEGEAAARRQAEAYLAQAQRLTHTGSWAINARSDVVYLSEETFQIFAFDPQHGLPSIDQVLQRIHPEERDRVKERSEGAIRNKADYEDEFRITLPGGAVRYIHRFGHPVFDTKGELIEEVGTVVDVTDSKLAEQALRRSKAYLAEAQRLSHTGSFGWSVATDEHSWSEETFRIFEYDTSTRITLPLVLERVHPDDRTLARDTLERAAQERKELDFEHRLLMPDGSVKHLHVVARCVMQEPGGVEFIGAVMDMTTAKRAEEALQEAQAELARVTRVTMMGELAASIAHEVNQPLAGIVTSASAGLNWLAKDPPNLLKTREAIERILRDGTRAGEVLNRIRTLLKRTPPNRSRTSVNQIIHEVVVLAGGELRQNNVELSVKLDSKLPSIVGDNIQLQQVLLNLIMNAVEAMASNANRRKVLQICSESGDLGGNPAISVKVSDTGIGLSTTDAGRLFEAFHTTKPQGMGMGLWISRSIIESHSGRLTAHCNDGPGATFQVLLPAETGGSE